jgi:acyl carrier protein
MHYVFNVIAETLPGPPLLTEETYLPGLQGFDSLAIVTILERLEETLDIEVEPTLLLPETFETPRSISELLSTSQRQSSISQQNGFSR